MSVTLIERDNLYYLSLTNTHKYYKKSYKKAIYKDFAVLTRQQITMFLYGLLNNKLFSSIFIDDRFGPRSLYIFKKDWYPIYEKFYNITLQY